MAESLNDVLAGSIGHYWVLPGSTEVDLEADLIAGSVKRDADSRVTLSGLTTERPWEQDPKDAASNDAMCAVGITENGGVLLSGLFQTRSRIAIGGSRASTVHFDVQSVVAQVPVERLKSGNASSVSADWIGGARWAGVQTTSEESTKDESGRLKSLTIRLQQIEAAGFELAPGLKFELGSTWHVDGPLDQRTVSAPLQVKLTSDHPKSIEQFVNDHAIVQDLLSVAFQGALTASSGAVGLDCRNGAPTRSRQFWNKDLMERPPGVREPKSMTADPLFYLADIGGLSGIQRWYELYEKHRRFVRPVTFQYRIGPTFAESQLIECGAAIDYWRGTHARTEKWAEESFQPLAVAQYVGDGFKEFVGGDVDKWAKLLWYHYNGLKHYIRDYKYAPEAVHCLALSALSLVTCAALKKVANDQTTACDRALKGHHWRGRRQIVQEWLATA